VTGRWTQPSCINQLLKRPNTWTGSLRSLQCVCVCVCVCGVLSVPSLYRLTLVWLKEGEKSTHRALCFSAYLWPMDLTIVSPEESGRKRGRAGGGELLESTVDNRSVVRDWYSQLWLFGLQPHRISTLFPHRIKRSLKHHKTVASASPWACVCVCVCVYGRPLFPQRHCGHGDGGGRLGSSTVGCRAEINCDCDSGERRMKQQATEDWHDRCLCAPLGDRRQHMQKGNFSFIVRPLSADTFNIGLSLISANPSLNPVGAVCAVCSACADRKIISQTQNYWNWGFQAQNKSVSRGILTKLTWGDDPNINQTGSPLPPEDCEALQYKARSNCSCQFHCCCRSISALFGLLSKTNLVLVGQRGPLSLWLFWRMPGRWLQLRHELSPYSPVGLGSQPCRPGHGTTAEREAEVRRMYSNEGKTIITN